MTAVRDEVILAFFNRKVLQMLLARAQLFHLACLRSITPIMGQICLGAVPVANLV